MNRASQLPCFVAVSLLASLGLSHLATTRTGVLLFTDSLLPPASLTPSSLALLEEGQVATPEDFLALQY